MKKNRLVPGRAQLQLHRALIKTREHIADLLKRDLARRDRHWEHTRDNLYSMEFYYMEELRRFLNKAEADALINQGVAPKPGTGLAGLAARAGRLLARIRGR
ncbi:MAG: hypothetical protein LBG89_00630 [Rickettsiales bacterium]|jgi:hypothetical protein|nr:hypothetical protein [Rickettsiales bacterium]